MLETAPIVEGVARHLNGQSWLYKLTSGIDFSASERANESVLAAELDEDGSFDEAKVLSVSGVEVQPRSLR